MKRTTLMATLTGVAVLFAGCSSTSGTATVGTTPLSPAVTSAASPSPAVSASASPSEMSSSESPSSTEPSSASSGSDGSSVPASSSTSGTGVARPTATTTTVGDKSGGLDAQSTKWFDAFCGGLAPVVSISSALTAAGTATGDSAAKVKQIVTLFGSLGGSLTKTAAALSKLPPPTFSGGASFAKKVETAFGTAGPALSAQAKKIAADPSSALTGMTGLTDSVTKAVAPLQDLQSLKLTPQTQAGIQAIPACQKVASLAGG